MFIVIRDIFNTLKGFTYSYIRKKSFADSMGRAWMFEVKSCIRTNANDQDTLSKFRYSIIGKVIEVRNNNITWFNVLEIFNNLLNGTTTISRQNTLDILGNESERFFSVNEAKEALIKVPTRTVQAGLFPYNREILTREST